MTRNRKITVFVLSLLFPLWVFGDPPVYFAKEIRGQVVDAETGRPLEGVVIVARWTLRWIGIGDSSTGGEINTLEAVTDREGNYFIPRWGPRPRPPLAFLDNLDPELTLFKSHFYPRRLSNRLLSYENHNRSLTRTSEWDGKTIQMKPFKGDDWEEYAWGLLDYWSIGTSDCVRECPRFVLALIEEDKRIQSVAPKGKHFPIVVNIERISKSDQEFLRQIKTGN